MWIPESVVLIADSFLESENLDFQYIGKILRAVDIHHPKLAVEANFRGQDPRIQYCWPSRSAYQDVPASENQKARKRSEGETASKPSITHP